MSKQNTIFFKGKQQVKYDFSAEEISTDGAIFLSEKIERKNGLIKEFCKHIPEIRDESKVEHTIEKMVKQRVYLMIQGYEDCNDEKLLRNDPLICEVLDGQLSSQSSLSRFENSLSISDIYNLSEFFLDRYIDSIDKKKKRIIIDADGTDDPTYGDQQLALFNGYYSQFMYNELLFHDGETGQLILPVLRPGNCHSNRWFVNILGKIEDRIRASFPEIEIIIRADCGFSGAEFYELADGKNLKFCLGLPSNTRLKKHTEKVEEAIRTQYLEQGKKFQFFMGPFGYQAESWHRAQSCYAKVESTGKGMNIRYYCSNIETKTARGLYLDFYVKRGDASENRIKELKNMCYADRLSCHKYTANYFRLFLSSLCYEIYRLIKELIKLTGDQAASKWQIDNIRLYLMKVGATIRKKIRSITISLSKSYICQELFSRIVALC